MGDTFYYRAKTLKTEKVLPALKHNKREIQAELGGRGHIDSTRTSKNYSLCAPQTALAARKWVKAAMNDAGLPKLPRKDSVAALELLFSLPVGSPIDHHGYFAACLDWTRTEFACPVFSAEVHLDESTPHCHVLLLPMKDGRMVGSALMGNRQTLKARQTSFNERVALPHGLTSTPKRTLQFERIALAGQVVTALNLRADPALHSAAWPVFRHAIDANPGAFAQCLGIPMLTIRPAKTVKTTAQIFLSPGAGNSRREQEAKPNRVPPRKPAAKSIPATVWTNSEVQTHTNNMPASGGAVSSEKINRPLCSVGFGHEPRLASDEVRVSEDAIESAWFNPDIGEFDKPSESVAHPGKLAAAHWVRDALALASRSTTPM